MCEKRFDIRLDPAAQEEYKQFKNPTLEIINKAIDKLESRADEVGKELSNYTNTKLAGCKEIKLRDAGVRIVFKITNEIVDILRVVYIYLQLKNEAETWFLKLRI